MQSEQPWCIYCGGTIHGTTADHMPPITVFANRYRHSGMEFLACKDCHEGTRPLDQVAGFLSRINPNAASPEAQKELSALFKGLRNNHRDVVHELMPSRDQLDRARRMGGHAAFSIGPKTNEMMLRFGARAALALHYHHCVEIIPSGGGIFVRWLTNERLMAGDFPHDFADMLPPPQSLKQGAKTQSDQFLFSSSATDDKTISQHQMTFRTSIAFQAFAARDVKDLERFKEKFSHMIFRPGFLKSETPAVA